MTTKTQRRTARNRSTWIAACVLLGACAEEGAAVRSADTTVAPSSTSSVPAPSTTDPGASEAPTSSLDTVAPAPTPSTDATETTAAYTIAPADASSAGLCPAGEYPAFGALDQSTGDIVWSTCDPDEAYRRVVGASEGLVVLAESNGSGASEAIALDAQDGTQRWHLPNYFGQAGVPPGPVDAQGVVVLSTDPEGTPFVIGVDANTGVERWRLEPGETVLATSDDLVVVAAALALTGDPSKPPSGGIRGIDRVTGTQRWSNPEIAFADFSGVGVGRGASAVTANLIAIPTATTLTGVDLATGQILWTAAQLDHPNAADGVIVGANPRIGPTPPSMRAIDEHTGIDLWSGEGAPSYGDLWAVGDGVVVTIGAPLLARELADGAQRWTQSASANAQPQLISEGSLVVLWDSYIAALSTTDGQVVWEKIAPLHSPLMSSVASNGTSVFVSVNSLPWND